LKTHNRLWLNLEAVSRDNMRQIDSYIRQYEGFTEIGLFSRPTLKIENGLQYMAYTPKEPYSPFLDLHLRGPIDADLWSAIYTGKEEEHQRWSILTGWRKKLNNNQPDAEQTYRDHIERYWPDELEKFIHNPQAYYKEKFPARVVPKILLE
jgi:hypothetical protein